MRNPLTSLSFARIESALALQLEHSTRVTGVTSASASSPGWQNPISLMRSLAQELWARELRRAAIARYTWHALQSRRARVNFGSEWFEYRPTSAFHAVCGAQ
jgi:hypothetical protein